MSLNQKIGSKSNKIKKSSSIVIITHKSKDKFLKKL